MTGENMQDVSADEGKTAGCVKWFNNKAGYGFVSVTSGDHSGTDIFVHHSAIQVGKEQYKYLVQGEYVHFDLRKADAGSHEWQASNVRGLNDGKLMCETRFETRGVRGNQQRHSSPSRSTQHMERPHLDRIERDASSSQRIRYRGPGPREGEEWMLVRRSTYRPETRGRRQDNRRQDNRRNVPQETDDAPTFSPPS